MKIADPDSGIVPDILIAGGTNADRQSLSDLLGAAGCRVRPAADGETALRGARAEPPDLVLLDATLSGMDRVEVCSQLKADENTRDIPVIFIGSPDDERSKTRGFQAGGADFIGRPFHTQEVLARVKTHLAINRLQKKLESQKEQLLKELAERKQAEERIERLNNLKESLLGSEPLEEKLKWIADGVVDILGADFARIWITGKGDICDSGCMHANPVEGPHVCRDRNRCLHLAASSGRYTHLDGAHGRVPFGGYKIGRIAAAEEIGFLTNDVTRDPRVHNHPWARELGLVSFAGCRLLARDGTSIGVLALFSKRALSSEEAALLQTIAGTASSVIQVSKSLDALRESENKYRLIAENTADLISTLDMNLHFTYVGPATKRLRGFTAEEAMAQPLDQVLTPDSMRLALSVFEEEMLLEAGGTADPHRTRILELEEYKKDGSTVWLEVNLSFLRDKNLNPVEILVVSRDISDRRRAEDELRQYAHIVSSTKDMLALINKNFVYLAANAAYLRAFAKTADEVIGRTVADVCGETFFRTVSRPRAERCLAGENVRYQDWFEFPSAGRRFMDVAYSPYLGPDGAILGFVVTGRDITEQKSLHARFLQAQKMESIGRLAGGVAHDYNNMLSIISGYAELALEKVSPSDPLHPDLTAILSAAKRSTDITRQLLAFARNQTISPKVLDLNDAIESMLKMLRRLIGENIDLAWLPGANIWPVKIDPSQIDQLLANLCVNARDAIADVGKVIIETKNTAFDEDYCHDNAGFVPGAYVLVAVSDNGCGMGPETMDKIFEPFFTTKGLGKGTGLGLATVYGLVKQNDGFVKAYSEPGTGTTIKVYLPRHGGQTVEARPDARVDIPLSRGETVLLVEDDPSILKLAQKILQTLGFHVVATVSPDEAIRIASEFAGKIDLLVTDVVMPVMNGRELSEKLKPVCPDLKVLFMSGYTANVIAHRGILDEGVSFIIKPFSRSDLAVKIREVLDEAKRPVP